jgi:transposase
MRPLTISGSDSIVVGLQQEIQRSGESRYDHRLHGVLLVAQGLTCPEVGGLLGDAPRTVEYWVRRFEERGLAGLAEGERSGRPPSLNAAQMQEVNGILRGKPTDAGMAVNLWDGKTLAAWIEKNYGIRLGVRQCQRLFRQLGFRLRKPRPAIAKANPAQQKAHKKTPEANARFGHRSVGAGRSTLPATWFSLSHVGTAGSQGSDPLSSPDPA